MKEIIIFEPEIKDRELIVTGLKVILHKNGEYGLSSKIKYTGLNSQYNI